MQPISRRAALGGLAASLMASAAITSPASFRQVVLRRGGPALGPGIVTGVEIMGDISIAITNPSSISVPMPTNGIVARITTSGTASHTGLDTSKISLSCRTRGHHPTTGAQQWVSHTVGVHAKLYGPYNEKSFYQPVLGEFYVVLSEELFKQDATWLTEVLSVDFAAGWLTAEPAGAFTGASVTRSDSLAFQPFAMRDLTFAFDDAVQAGGTVRFRCGAVNAHAQSFSQVACVEAWVVDGSGNLGPEVRISDMTLSDLTPGTEPGLPVPLYEANLPITGLVSGLARTRFRVKPWRGPPVESATYGTAIGEACSPVQGIPFHLDLNGSHVRLYGILSYDPALATIASNLNVATVDVSGLSTTIAGALASTKTYADVGTIFTAVRRVNNSGSALTIADPVTGGSFSYQRTTTHNDCSGASAVCPPVAGSTPGTNTGVYTLRQSLDALPPGNVAPEIRSQSGGFSDDVRWRGVTTAGTEALAWNVRNPTTRLKLRGLYLDAVGLSVDSNVPVFTNWASSDATVYTEATIRTCLMVDCKERGSLTNSQPETFVPNMFHAWTSRVRNDVDYRQAAPLALGVNHYSHGPYAWIGSKVVQAATTTLQIPGVYGCRLTNIGLGAQTSVANFGTGNRLPTRGALYINVDQEITTLASVTRLNTPASGGPIRGGEGWLNVLCRSTLSGAVNFTSWLISADNVTMAIEGLVMHQCGSNFPNQAEGSGRINDTYNDVGYISAAKRTVMKGVYAPGYNIKGDNFNTASTLNGLTNFTHTTAISYFAGSLVKDATPVGFQAIRDVPASIALTDTSYWFASGVAPTVSFLEQPRRQGNMATRYKVGWSGVVFSSSQDSSTVPSATSWYGYAFPANGQVQSARATWFSSGSTVSISGPLWRRMKNGLQPAPFDLYGTAYPANDFHVGPVQAAA